MSDSNKRIGRRNYIKAIGIGAAAGLAGCLESSDDGEGNGNGGNGNGNGNGGNGNGNGNGNGGNGNGGTTNGQEVESVTVGLNHPLTGNLSFAGSQINEVGEVAARHINEDGGIESLGGAEIEVISADNEGVQEQGGQAEQQLIDQGAIACMGCYSSPVSLAAIQTAERERVPHVIDVSISPAILQDNDFDFGYRSQGTPLTFTRDFARYGPSLARGAGKQWETMSITSLDNLYGDSVKEGVKEFLPDEGVEIIEENEYQFGAESLSSQATAVERADPNAVFFVGYDPGAIRFCNALQDIDYEPNLLVGSGTPMVSSPSVFNEVGEFMNGTIGNNADFNYTKDLTDKIFNDFEEMHGDPLEIATAGQSYVAMEVVRQALEESGTTDPVELNDAIKNVRVESEDHPMVMDEVEFRDDGELAGLDDPEYVSTAFMQVQDLETTHLAPERAKEGDIQF
jgi:branched-chain amino acid transport system substrate-binding protein